MLYIKPDTHFNNRIDVCKSQRQHHVQPVSQPLYIVCAISNPQRFYSRYKNYYAFEKHIQDSGGILYTVELALRDRHHEVTDSSNPRHIQLRAESELWHKENLLNIGIRHFPADWHYGAWIDADFLMTRPDWITETIHQLQHHHWVQLFSTYSDLNESFIPYRTMPSFVNVHKNGEAAQRLFKLNSNVADYGGLKHTTTQHPLVGATGGAWAFRREAFDDVGGLLDTCVLGSADWHMSFGLSNRVSWAAESKRCTQGYIASLKRWSDRASKYEYKIGYIDNHAIHSYHGDKNNRSYGSRWQILQKHDFDPLTDLKVDWQGVLTWVGNKPALEEAIREYFKSRKEDN